MSLFEQALADRERQQHESAVAQQKFALDCWVRQRGWIYFQVDGCRKLQAEQREKRDAEEEP